jgi:hypothetical protein
MAAIRIRQRSEVIERCLDADMIGALDNQSPDADMIGALDNQSPG